MLRTWMLAGVLMALVAVAQEVSAEEAPQRNVVALDVAGLLQNTIGVSGERALTEQLSVRLGLRAGLSALWTRNPISGASPGGAVTRSSTRDTSLALEPGARFFLTGHAPEGLWVGPQVGLKLGWHRWSSTTTSGNISAGTRGSSQSLSVSGSALAGYSAVLGKGVSLQAAAGLGLSYGRPLGTTYALGGGVLSMSEWALAPVTQLSLGYAF